MSVNYSVTIRTNRLQQVINAIDGGATNGVLRLQDSLGNILSSLSLARPSAVINSGVATFNSLPLVDPAAALSGSATQARVEDGNGNIVISGLVVTVGSSPDIILSPNNIIAAGQTIAITAATITGN